MILSKNCNRTHHNAIKAMRHAPSTQYWTTVCGRQEKSVSVLPKVPLGTTYVCGRAHV
jgi:hypothetical protein